MSAVAGAIEQLSRSISENGATPDHVFMPYEDVCQLRGVPMDPWLADLARVHVHIHAGEWHFIERCTPECPR